jgi:hypothetical protein
MATKEPTREGECRGTSLTSLVSLATASSDVASALPNLTRAFTNAASSLAAFQETASLICLPGAGRSDAWLVDAE